MSNHVPKFQPGQVVTFTAQGAITGGQVVEIGTADRTVKVAGAASTKAIGTAGFDVLDGESVAVHLGTTVDTAEAAATIAIGAEVEAAAAGKIQTVSSGRKLGIALTGGPAGTTIQFARA